MQGSDQQGYFSSYQAAQAYARRKNVAAFEYGGVFYTRPQEGSPFYTRMEQQLPRGPSAQPSQPSRQPSPPEAQPSQPSQPSQQSDDDIVYAAPNFVSEYRRNTLPVIPVQQWHLDVQHEFLTNTVLQVSYVGSKGTHLTLQSDLGITSS